MVRVIASQLTVLCTVVSFAYTTQSLGRHSLTERPRLSILLVFLLSGFLCFIASFLVKWIPGLQKQQSIDDVRLDGPSDLAKSKSLAVHLPNRPRKWSIPTIIVCIVLRLEAFHRVNYSQQCSAPGIESFLCLFLIGYEVYSNRRRWGLLVPDDPDDPWRSIFHDIYDWFSGPRVAMVISFLSTFIFSYGTFLSVSRITRSTYLCFEPIDNRSAIIALQWAGIVLDAAIIIYLWRVIAYTRGLALRLRTLGTISVLSSLTMALLWLVNHLLSNHLVPNSQRLDLAFGSLYAFDILVDGFAFACLMVSAIFWVCDASPVPPATTITFIVGTWASIAHILRFGDWLHLSRPDAIGPLWIIAFGTICFTYSYNLRHFLFIRRFFFVLILSVLLIVGTIYTLVKQPQVFHKRHPVDNLIYKARVQHEQWLKRVKTSGSLKVAVNLYQKHHDGRNPPPNFGDWYDFSAGGLVIDQFTQIDRDLQPFWNLPPQVLRQRADIMARSPGIATLTIKDGQVAHSGTKDDADFQDLEQLAAMIRNFSNFLPNMVLPINLSPAPRILPTWHERDSPNSAELSSFANLLSTRSIEHGNQSAVLTEPRGSQGWSTSEVGLVSAGEFRQMQTEACPPGSRAKTSPQWTIGQFCEACIRRHSQGSLLTKWDRALDVCSQPDLKYLHGFSLAEPSLPPIRRLAPLFGASKTDEFSDIIIPLPRPRGEEPDIRWQFKRRYDTMIWTGSVKEQSLSPRMLRGSHKFRLLHLISHPGPRDRVTMVLPLPGSKDRFGYERVSASEASVVVPFAVGITDHSACVGENCDAMKQVYGVRDAKAELLEYRYVLLLDEDDGPPLHFLRTLRSRSVPFVSTIFRTWYTERLVPWLHFVPVDLRYQALHTIFAYFSGTEDRAKINGRQARWKGRTRDAERIGEEGQKWAEKALGPEEMQVYLFRLLLEWGRLIDDRRDDIGFRVSEEGEFVNNEWTSHQDPRRQSD